MAHTRFALRFTIVNPNAVSPFTAGMATVPEEHFSVTSHRSGQHPHIHLDGVTLNGARLDALRGLLTDGAFTVPVIDADETPVPPTPGVDVGDEFTAYGTNITLLNAAWPTLVSTSYGGNAWTGPNDAGTGTVAVQFDTAIQCSTLTTGETPAHHTTPVVDGSVMAYRRRTFTGLTPLTDYQVEIRVKHRGIRVLNNAASVCSGGVAANAPNPPIPHFIVSNGTDVTSVEASLGPTGVGVGGDPSQPWQDLITAPIQSNASGELTVDVGWFNLRGVVACYWDIDYVRIAAQPGTPATSGPYITRNLADPAALQQLQHREAWLEMSHDGGATWSDALGGYVTQITQETPLRFVFEVGDGVRTIRQTKIGRTDPMRMGLIGQPFRDRITRPTCILGGPVLGGFPPHLPDYGLPLFRVAGVQADVDGNDGWVALSPASPAPYPPDYGQFELWWHYIGGRDGFFDGDNFDRPKLVNPMVQDFFVDGPRRQSIAAVTPQAVSRGAFPDLRVWLLDPASAPPGATVIPRAGAFKPLGIEPFDRRAFRFLPPVLFSSTFTFYVEWKSLNPSALATPPLPTVGTEFAVVMYPARPSEQFPLHLVGHPADVLRHLFEDHAGVSCPQWTEARDVEGEGLRVSLRYTNPDTTVSDVADMLGATLSLTHAERSEPGESALGRNLVSAGRYTPANVIPPAPLTVADLRLPLRTPVREQRPDQRCNLFRPRFTLFAGWHPGTSEPRPFDDLVTFRPPIEIPFSSDGVTPDADVYGEQALVVDVPGEFSIATTDPTTGAPSAVVLDHVDFATALARERFDRHARGAVGIVIPTLTGLYVGQRVALNVPHLADARRNQTPTSQRGGARWYLVTQVRGRLGLGGVHFEVEALDDGAVAAYNPTLVYNVTPDPSDPQHGILLEIQNVATLAADEALLDVFVGVGSTVPSATDYGVRIATLDTREATGDPWSVRLGPIPAGTNRWLRLVPWRFGEKPGISTLWNAPGFGVDGTVNPPGGPGVDPGLPVPTPTPPPITDGDLVSVAAANVGTDVADLTLTWDANGPNPTNPVRVRLTGVIDGGFPTSDYAGSPVLDGGGPTSDYSGLARVDGGTPFGTLATVITLPPGSTTTPLVGLTPATQYAAEVAMIDPVSGATLGTVVTTTFETAAGSPTVTLAVPGTPTAYATVDPGGASIPGLVGLVVTPTVPAGVATAVSFEAATETSAGSGTPGSYAVYATAPAGASGTPLWASQLAPNDGRRRYFRARLTGTGPLGAALTPSGYTSVVSVLPWTTQPAPDAGALVLDGGGPASVYNGPYLIDGGGPTSVYTGPLWLDGGGP